MELDELKGPVVVAVVVIACCEGTSLHTRTISHCSSRQVLLLLLDEEEDEEDDDEDDDEDEEEDDDEDEEEDDEDEDEDEDEDDEEEEDELGELSNTLKMEKIVLSFCTFIISCNI